MSTNHQFSIAIHILAALGHAGEPLSSGVVAQSVNTNASFVRRILARLSKAGLVRTTTGKGGACSLAKPASSISLLEVYRAVEPAPAFSLHAYENQKGCSVSCNIKVVIGKVQERAQTAMEKSLASTRISDVISDLKRG